jgi:RNA polymerase-binding transcription factor DksA
MSTTVDIERCRTTLLEERTRVQRAIANLRDDHPGTLDDEAEEISGTSDNHLAETASVTLNREIDYTLEENSGHVLNEIDAALKRIEAGTYGICTVCDKEIAPERLEAYPSASLCMDDARKAERR